MPAGMDERELSRLLSALCDEAAEPEQIEWLDDALQRDDRTRQMYLEYLALHGEIARLLSESQTPPPTSLVDLEAVFAASPPAEAAAEPANPPGVISSWGSALDWRSHPIRFYATTFALTLLMWSVWGLAMLPSDQANRINEPPLATRSPSVARLVRAADAVWSPGATPWQEGVGLQPGWRIALEAGVVELQFASGANVLLAGPVQFVISDANAGKLDHGQLSAHVPPAARGFVVQSPRATITDLGTDFDVEVNADNQLRLAVFTGSVRLTPHPHADGAPANSLPVVAGESVEVLSSGAVEPRRIAPERLVQRPAPRDATELLAFYRLGEDDPGAVPGAPALAEISDHRGLHPLIRHGSPRYAARHSNSERLCVDFSAAGSVYQGPAPAGLADAWILDAWVRAESVEKSAVVIYHGDTSYNGYGIMRDGEYWAGLFGGVAVLNFGAPVVVDKWTHLTLTRFEGETRFYVDGMQVGQLSRATPRPPQGDLMIGGLAQDPQQSFHGQIDDVRILRPASSP